MLFDHHVDDLALKSPKITVNCDFEKRALLSISSKQERIQIQFCKLCFIMIEKKILLWLGDLHITATYPFLFCIVTSQTRYLGKDVMSTKHTAKDST